MKTTVGILFAVLATATAHAAPLLVFDLTPSAGASATRVFSLPDPPVKIVKLLEQFATTGGTTGEQEELATGLRDALAGGDFRWIASRGDAVVVFALYDTAAQKPPQIDFDEVARRTRIAEDLSTLGKIVEEVTEKTAAPAEPSTVRAVRTVYNLTLARGRLGVSASAAPQKGEDVKKVSASAKLITGPAEHFFLSADLPVNQVSDMKYDASGQALGPAETPSTFYAGIDYQTGDVLRDRRTPAESIVIKALLKISKQPLDSYGIAVGYRLPSIKRWGFDLDAFSPFAGYIWTKTRHGTTTTTNGHARVGLSFNLDKALGWVQ